MLAATSRITVAIGLLPVPLRNIGLTAIEISAPARLFPGRFTVGVGHGVRDWMAQVGAWAGSPMTLLREYTTALSALLRGELVTARRQYVRLDAVALDYPPLIIPLLLIGGTGRRGVRLPLRHLIVHEDVLIFRSPSYPAARPTPTRSLRSGTRPGAWTSPSWRWPAPGWPGQPRPAIIPPPSWPRTGQMRPTSEISPPWTGQGCPQSNLGQRRMAVPGHQLRGP